MRCGRGQGQGRDCLAVSLDPGQLLAVGEVGKKDILAQARGQNAPVFAEGQAASRVDWLQGASDLVRRLDGSSLGRHGGLWTW